MLQIKTIRSQNSNRFDKEVNEALANGWTLTRRAVTRCMDDSQEFILHAELEKEIITEAEQSCENCKHCNKEPGTEPCLSCRPDGPWNWEAEK